MVAVTTAAAAPIFFVAVPSVADITTSSMPSKSFLFEKFRTVNHHFHSLFEETIRFR